ncbi:hypothetical protein [Streptomyces scabichelini]|uniref:hypothetical protein n=1 Tax=Streptomyces scabichelini TaxID=2711217 RepID=UPI0019D06B2B|nr:hypothetical protein [Streptomyces scabichelini]
MASRSPGRRPDIAYVGRWDTGSGTAATPNWAGTYLHAGVRGTVDLTPQPLPGTHTLRISYRSGDTVFQGLVLDSGARTVSPAMPSGLIEFVGDSITAGALTDRLALDSYARKTGERLGMRHTRIARASYCLVTQSGCTGLRGQSAYGSLLRKVRAACPQAWILALETFRGRFVPQTEAAVKAAVDGGDSRASFVDTTGWLGSGDLTDSVHPNDQGHRAIADRLAPVIAARIGG